MIIPDDMIRACGKVFDGEYSIPQNLLEIYDMSSPIILDIGANVGAFTRWAKYKWPKATIYSYEPLVDCYEFLIKNTEDLPNVYCNNVAISNYNGSSKIYYGTDNRGMSSLHKSEHTRDQGIEVQVISAKSLPICDILKCDTEGSEVAILESISFLPKFILVEYHSLRDREIIEQMYKDTYVVFESKIHDLVAGTLKLLLL